jgi:hypothetical protein
MGVTMSMRIANLVLVVAVAAGCGGDDDGVGSSSDSGSSTASGTGGSETSAESGSSTTAGSQSGGGEGTGSSGESGGPTSGPGETSVTTTLPTGTGGGIFDCAEATDQETCEQMDGCAWLGGEGQGVCAPTGSDQCGQIMQEPICIGAPQCTWDEETMSCGPA